MSQEHVMALEVHDWRRRQQNKASLECHTHLYTYIYKLELSVHDGWAEYLKEAAMGGINCDMNDWQEGGPWSWQPT